MGTFNKLMKVFSNKIFWIALCAVIMISMFGINIWLAIKYPGDNKSNIIATISGLISVLATIILGIIAIVQTRKYKIENDSFNEYQQHRDWRIEQKALIEAYANGLENCYNEFKRHQYLKIINECLINVQRDVPLLDVLVYDEILKNLLDGINYTMLNNLYYFDNTEDLLNICNKYIVQLRLYLKDYKRYIKSQDMKRISVIGDLYKKLNELFCKVIFQIRLFSTMIVTNEDFNETQKLLQEKKEKQTDFIKKIEESLKEIGNGQT